MALLELNISLSLSLSLSPPLSPLSQWGSHPGPHTCLASSLTQNCIPGWQIFLSHALLSEPCCYTVRASSHLPWWILGTKHACRWKTGHKCPSQPCALDNPQNSEPHTVFLKGQFSPAFLFPVSHLLWNLMEGLGQSLHWLLFVLYSFFPLAMKQRSIGCVDERRFPISEKHSRNCEVFSGAALMLT
jgi:hypothetical protein